MISIECLVKFRSDNEECIQNHDWNMIPTLCTSYEKTVTRFDWTLYMQGGPNYVRTIF